MDNYAVLFGKSLGAGSGGSGTDNYNELTNKPSINGIALTGNKTSANLGLQDAISDLAAIRSGAAAGATAVQPADMRTALAGKQDTISDLSEIRSGAAAGATAVQPSDLQTTVQELQTEIETKVTLQQVYGDAIQILANSNLNNYTIPGIYYALVAAASTIENTPYTATGFRLVIEKNTPSGAAVFQTIYPTSRSHLEFFRRIYEGGAWSSWCKFEGTVVS